MTLKQAPPSPISPPGTAKPRWELVVADDLTRTMAGKIGKFIQSFTVPANAQSRRSQSGDYYLWKINHNPYGHGLVSLAMDGDRVVGTTTITPKRAWHCGQWIQAAEIGDTFTDPAYQRQGIFSSLVLSTRDRAIANGVRLIFGTPNGQSLVAYEKNCQFFRKVGLDLRLCVWPVRPISALASKFTAPFLSNSARIVDHFLARTINLDALARPNNCIDSKCKFDAEFDELNAQLHETCEFMLGRSAYDLNFRVMENPEHERYGMIRSYTSDGSLSGALIYKETIERGLKVLFIADCFARSPREIIRLWQAGRVKAVVEGHHILASWMPLSISAFLSHLALPPLPVSRKEVILYDHDLGAKALRSTGPWRFSILDSDNI